MLFLHAHKEHAYFKAWRSFIKVAEKVRILCMSSVLCHCVYGKKEAKVLTNSKRLVKGTVMDLLATEPNKSG